MNKNNNNKLISIGKTAKILGISVDTLRRWEKKGILSSFRASLTSKRYYRQQDIDAFLEKKSIETQPDLKQLAEKWATSQSPIPLPPDLYCQTNDVFLARLQHLELEIKRRPEFKDIFSLLIAIIGEIGNNSFNHNIGNWPDESGIFFGYNLDAKQIVLADRGQGIFKTLKRVVPDLKDDQQALKTAFTEYISGRAPEDRGNGLKFVKDVIIEYPFKLKFYTGQAELSLEKNTPNLNIKKSPVSFHGCMAIINFK